MSSRRSVRQLVVAVLVGVLVGGGLMALTPAGAEVSNAAATNWKKIWKKSLKPLADKRYYTKSQANSAFASKAESSASAAAAAAAAQAGATAASNSATDTKLGSYYTKTQADAKYAPAQPLYRGSYMVFGNGPAASFGDSASISFGATFPAAPVTHYIKLGDPVPVGCSGTSVAPNAAPGHLCVFESYTSNLSSNRGICRGSAPVICGLADPFGATIYTYIGAAGDFSLYGTWAARPGGPVVNPAFAPAPQGASNNVVSGLGQPSEE